MYMEKIKQLYQFLKEYNQIKNPSILTIDKNEDYISISDLPKSKFIKYVHSEDPDKNIILYLSRPVIEDFPQLPKRLDGWISDLDNDTKPEKVKITESIKVNIDGQTKFTFFEDDKYRVEAYQQWFQSFEQWYERTKPDREAKQIFRKIYQFSDLLENQSENFELVFANVNLYLKERAFEINHPLLTQRVEVTIDTSNNGFMIELTDDKVELYSSLMRKIEQLPPNRINEVLSFIEESEYDLTSPGLNNEAIARITTLLDSVLIASDVKYKISLLPTLLLRKRNQGYARFIETILEDINSDPNKQYPQFLVDLVDPNVSETENVVEEVKSSLGGIDQEILLTLPANDEQLRITKLLRQNGAVLVQGPPGTGKTHTIANLIGHLLSEGKSILVTAQTDKALAVVKDKVYRDDKYDLQSLCISVNKERSQRKEMDFAIDAISDYGSNFVEDKVKKEIVVLESKRIELFESLEKAKVKFLKVKQLEFVDIVYDNTTIQPIEAAKFVGTGKGKYDYLDLKTKDFTLGFPLTQSELERLYYLNTQITKEDINVLSKDISYFKKFWTIDKFSQHLIKLEELKHLIPDGIEQDEKDVEMIKMKINLTTAILDKLNNVEPNRDIFNFSVKDKTSKNLLIEEINDAKRINLSYDKYDIYVKRDDITINKGLFTNEVKNKIEALISKGVKNPFKSFQSLFNKALLNAFSTSSNVNDLETLKKVLFVAQYETDLENIVGRLNKYISKVENIDSFTVKQFNYQLDNIDPVLEALTVYDDSVKVFLQNEFGNQKKLLSEVTNTLDSYQYISDLLKSELEKLSMLIVKHSYNEMTLEFDNFLNSVSEYSKYSENFGLLVSAVESRDSTQYSLYYSVISSIYNKSEQMSEYSNLLSKIENITPILATRIKNKSKPHNSEKPPENIFLAWKYVQLSQQLSKLNEEYRKGVEEEISKLNSKIINNARALAHAKAWYRSKEKQTKQLQQDLQAWRTASKKMPKSLKAKSAGPLRRTLRDLTPRCQPAIPVWIMSLSQLVEFYNAKTNKFDVIIIDEASQADMLSLTALYLGKQVIIVGDDKQVSPDTVGIKTEAMTGLQEQYLSGMTIQSLLNKNTSIYDLAQLALFKKVILTEHFRCVPDIIQFSNSLFYDGKIQALRDSTDVKVRPFVKELRIENGRREPNSKVNNLEAEKTIQKIQELIRDHEYKDKTFGIISMLGQDQSALLQNKIQETFDLFEIKNRKILVGSPSHFQGDERDVIFINLIDDSDSCRLVAYDGGDSSHSRAYNVAASRAKDQMWVVHSLNPERDLKADDLRYKLINHVRNPQNSIDESKLMKSESPFELEVMRALLQKNYNVIPQYKVANYRIDMVIEGASGRVALECDGEAFHGQEQAENDFLRQLQLERLGWRFIRLRGSEYYSNKENALERVISRLNELSIFPSKGNKSPLAIEKLQDFENEVIEYVEIVDSDIKDKLNDIRNDTDELDLDSIFSMFRS
jgi:very-short-patch-repair endonuclease/DNA polymerase III delta prime subunit